jgi:hypothetical protein
MNATQAPLRFEKIRNFSGVFSDTRRVIRENFGVFFKSILFLVGPVALITCTLDMYYQVNLLTPGDVPDFNHLGSYFALTAIYTQLRWTINGFVTAIVVSHFVKVYREKGPGKFEVGDVARSMFRDILGNLLAFVVMFLSVGAITAIFGYLVYGLAGISLGAVFIMVFGGWLGYVLIRFPFWYFVYSVFFARTARNLNVFSAMGFAGKVFSGSWWNTWAIFFCMWLLLWVIGLALSAPAQIVTVVIQMTSYGFYDESADWKLLKTILFSLGEFAKTMVNSVFMVAVALHFYSLKEKIDGEGTQKLVAMIGEKQEDEGIELTY